MKKLFSISLILSFIFAITACVNEEENLFDQSAAERLNAASDLYSARLMAQPNGWAMQLYPTNDNEYPYGNGYLLLCRFNKDHSVVVSMNNVFSENVYRTDTSLWEVITDNGPVLSFNSYNRCLHAFSNPEDILFTGDSDNPNNEQGVGVGGDYEFIIVDAPEDASYMMLKGKKRGTYNLFTPVEEGVDYEDYLKDVGDFMRKMFPANNPTFDVFHTPAGDYKMTGLDDGIPNIYPYDGDEIIDESFNAFLITKRGNDYYLRLRNQFKVYPDGDEQSEQEFRYDPSQDLFIGTSNDAFVMDGDNPSRFFIQALLTDQRTWLWDQNSSMSESYAPYVTELANAFKDKKLTYRGNSLMYVDQKDKVYLRIKYRRSGSKDTNLDYLFNYSVDGNNITLTYEGPSSNNEVAMLTQIPVIQKLIDAVNGKIEVEPGQTRFNLNSLKLINASDNKIWFIATK